MVTYWIGRKDRKDALAPMLVVEREKFSGFLSGTKQRQFFEPKSSDQNPFTFTLDRRSFVSIDGKSGDKVGMDKRLTPTDGEEALVSLILSLKEKDDENPWEIVDYCRIFVKNVGAPMISFSIDSIEINFNNRSNAVLKANASYNKLNVYKDKNEEIEIAISTYYSTEGKYVMFDAGKQGKEDNEIKILETHNNVLGVYLNNNASLFNEIIVYCNTTNIYNMKYRQVIRIYEKENVLYSEGYLGTYKQKGNPLLR